MLSDVSLQKLKHLAKHVRSLMTTEPNSIILVVEIIKGSIEGIIRAGNVLETGEVTDSTRATVRSRLIRRQLFERLCQKPGLMPGYFQRFIASEGLQRTVCDYIAGMTDRFCHKTLNEI